MVKHPLPRLTTSAIGGGWLGLRVALLVGLAWSSGADAASELWQKTGKCASALSSLLTKSGECITVKPLPKVLGSGNDKSIKLTLPDNTPITASKIHEQKVGSALIWHGEVDGDPLSSVTFSVVNDAIVGDIAMSKGRMVRLRFAKGGVYVVELLDRKKIPLEAVPNPRPYSKAAVSAISACSDSPFSIDVLVAYTPAALLAHGDSEDHITARIYQAVFETNRSYIKSGVWQQINPVGIKKVKNYVEARIKGENADPPESPPWSVVNDLDWLTDGTNGLDGVHTARVNSNADLVVLVTHDPSGNGIANPPPEAMKVGSTDHVAQAFAVVPQETLTGTAYSFGHELGHLMGAHHNRTAGGGTYAYSYGHKESSSPCGPWMTIMAESMDAKTIPFWSNPNETYCDGTVMGNSINEDNRRTLNDTAPYVANFLCGLPRPSTVWMKDAWGDTGNEPEPSLDGQPMWKSPYIWVRNERDAGSEGIPPLQFQHIHQNPRKGQLNHIYVKVHNSKIPPAADVAGSADGSVKVWVANASTGLSLSDFTEIQTVPIPGFSDNSTRIAEVPWTPTVAGHFCLMARWVPTGTVHVFPESTVDAYVRQNNDVVWRNVNIVDLATAPDSSATELSFIVRNHEKIQKAISLHVTPSDRYPQRRSFLDFGDVQLKLDQKLLAFWKRGGDRGQGIDRKGDAIYLAERKGGVIADLIMDPNSEGKITIIFSRKKAGPKYPRDKFSIDVVQKTAAETVGGITYEIHTQKQ